MSPLCPAHAQPDHPKIPTPKVGILLANLGTPDNYDYWSMRRYLGEFLSDRRRKPVDDHHKSPNHQDQGVDAGAVW